MRKIHTLPSRYIRSAVPAHADLERDPRRCRTLGFARTHETPLPRAEQANASAHDRTSGGEAEARQHVSVVAESEGGEVETSDGWDENE